MFKNQSTIFLSRLIFNQVNFPLKVYIKIVLQTAIKKNSFGQFGRGLAMHKNTADGWGQWDKKTLLKWHKAVHACSC